MTDQELHDACQTATTTALAEAFPDKQIALEILLALIGLSVEIWAECIKKETLIKLVHQAHAHPHGLAAMRVKSKLTHAMQRHFLDEEYHSDLVLTALIGQYHTELSKFAGLINMPG